MDIPSVSVIIPCRNEEKFILQFLESLENQSYPKDRLEILIGDGASEDQTVQLIEKFTAQSDLKIIVVNNPQKTVPFALNKMIQQAQGEYIIRLDAHAVYPPDYIEKLIEVATETGAQNVGAQWTTCPGDDSTIAKIIAKCTSHKFGVGNTAYRVKKFDANDTIEVDTVPYGCFPKQLFSEIGLFDEDLTRNQDDEFNARILKNDGKIILVPSLKIKYFARKNWPAMRLMFFQYGYFKPLSNKKLGAVSTLRQLIPPFFTVFLFTGFIPALFWLPLIGLYLAGLFLYGIANIYFSVQVSNGIKSLFLSCWTFFQIHVSYGLGYLKGLWDFVILSKQNNFKVKT